MFDEGLGIPILLGRKEIILELKEEIGFVENVMIIDPKTDEEKHRRDEFGELFWKKRQRKGITLLGAKRLMRERNYFGAMMVNTGLADAMVTGYTRSYSSVIRPILELIDKTEGVNRVAATSIILSNQGPIFLSDTTINIDPNAEELANIARMTARAVKLFGLKPSVAMLSFSNFGSSNAKSPLKIREAVEILHQKCPEMVVDGEIQVDFALNPKKIEQSFPFSRLNTGKIANVLIFPNLEAANITYKMLNEVDSLNSIGPILLGLEKPVHIIPLGSSVDEMVNLATIAVVDAQERERKKNKIK